MGPGALSTFQNAGVTILQATENTVKGNIESFKEGKLKELVGGCEHAHHQNTNIKSKLRQNIRW